MGHEDRKFRNNGNHAFRGRESNICRRGNDANCLELYGWKFDFVEENDAGCQKL